MRAWIDGRLIEDAASPAVSVIDHGVTVGDGVFEALKVVDGLPFALEAHLERMRRSARGLGLGEVDTALVRQGVKEVLSAEHIVLGKVRITLTAGRSPLGSGRFDALTPTLIVVADAQPPAEPTTAAIGVPWTRNERGALAGLKTTSYGENVLALEEAHRRGASEAVFANTQGHLCEGTGTNVFYVLDGELRTPTLASGCLAGVTRALVLEWFGGVEVDAPVEVLEVADEIFLTSSSRDVQPLVRWNDRALAPGPVAAEAQAVWRRREPELLGL